MDTRRCVYRPRRTLPGLDMSRILLKERGAFRNADTGGAWLLSARGVRCWVKSHNEHNPRVLLSSLSLELGTDCR
ncbi:hypothetical protein L1887_32030 [Cichorium endivia]|nr:hypothetical protein L1887_32030 [Cichorium endivia]